MAQRVNTLFARVKFGFYSHRKAPEACLNFLESPWYCTDLKNGQRWSHADNDVMQFVAFTANTSFEPFYRQLVVIW